MPDTADHLALGTAQLGMPYGVANRDGKPGPATAEQIVAGSWARGVRFFDTAQAYGDSESVLGAALHSLGVSRQASIISKLAPGIDGSDSVALRKAVRDSLERLKIETLWGFLLHREEQLDYWDGPLGENLEALKREGLIMHLGVSVYTPRRALQALEMAALDVIQVPANVFDRRMARGGVFRRAEVLGKTVFVRSVYLQGFVWLTPATLPERLTFARRALETFTSFCSRKRCDCHQYAIDYVRSSAPSAVLVIGADTPNQAEDNCVRVTKVFSSPDSFHEWDRLWPEDDPRLIDPSQWSLPKT